MNVETQASVRVPVTVEQAFALATDMAGFPQFFKGAGPVPAVLKVEWQPGATPVPGARRNVHNSDGSVIIEELIELTAPERHSYRLVSGFKPPFAWLVKSARGDWSFTRECDGTRIDWRYAFELSSPLALPLTAPIVRVFFRRAMQDCLEAMRDRLVSR